jgi:plasmid stabilization system protein ParE
LSDLTLVVRPEVDDDLLEAETWYNQKESGLGTRFLQDVRDTIDRLLQNPFRYQVRYRRRQVRWTYTRSFPFRVVFAVREGIVVVYAVIHGRRHDRHWKTRI